MPRLTLTAPAAARAAALGLAYWLAVVVAVELVNPVEKIALFWPPNAIAAAVLILAPRRDWPLYLTAAALAYFAGRVPTGHFPLYVYFGFCTANIVEILIVAQVTRAVTATVTHETLPKALPAAVLAAIPATIASGVIGAAFAVSAIEKTTYVNAFAVWATGDLSGMILVMPALLAWLAPGRPPLRLLSRTEVLEAAAITAAIVSVGGVIAAYALPENRFNLIFPYIAFPILLWAALRLGVRGAATAALGVGLFAVGLTYFGYGPFNFAGMTAFAQVLLMKLGLVIIAVTTVFMACAVTARQRAERALRDSEHRFRTFAENSPVVFSLKDADGRYLRVNREWEETFGKTNEDVVGKTSAEVHVGAMRDFSVAHDAQIRDTLTTVRDEFTHQTADGERTFVDARFPIFDDGGAFVGIGAASHDITERKRAEALLKDAIESLGEGFSLWDSEDRLVLCNKKYSQSMSGILDILKPGVKFDAVIRALAERGLRPEAVGHEEEWITKRIQRFRNPNPGQPYDVQTSDGRWIEIHDFRTSDGGTATVRNDITDRKRAEQALKDSEERLKDLAESASDWFWEMDEHFRFSHFSEQRLEQTGLAPDGFLGRTRWDVAGIDPDENEMWRAHRETLQAHQPFRDFQYEYVDGTGRRLIASVNGKPVFDDGGVFKGYRGTATDITEQKLAEEALHEVRERFRIVVDNLPMAISLKDRRHRFILVNKRLKEWYGVTDEEILGRRAEEAFSAEEGRNANRYPQEEKVLRTDHVATRTDRKVRADGTVHDLEIIKFPITGGAGETAVIGTIEIDVTERKRAEEALRHALQSAEDANRAKSDFLATMSHEFRTPLNAILGFAEILNSQFLGPVGEKKYLEYAADIHASGEHLLGLVNDLLDLSAIEAGRRPLVRETVALDGLVDECLKTIEKRAVDTGVRVAADLPRHLPDVYADKRALKQILLNVLTNAVKFTLDGGTVTVSAQASKTRTTFRIADTGVGIPPDKLSILTDPFTRLEPDPYQSPEGWGLGLTITQSLVDLHGGKLGIKSVVGEGTEVTVEIPNGGA